MQEKEIDLTMANHDITQLQDGGATVAILSDISKVVGLIAIKDPIKPK